jgi:biotin operon repressor
MKKLSAKQKMLNALNQKTGQNTFTVKQARQRFGISNVTARIDELRQDGISIQTNTKLIKGKKVSFYRLGKPTKSLLSISA